MLAGSLAVAAAALGVCNATELLAIPNGGTGDGGREGDREGGWDGKGTGRGGRGWDGMGGGMGRERGGHQKSASRIKQKRVWLK